MSLNFLINQKDLSAIGADFLNTIAFCYGEYLAPIQGQVEVRLVSLQEMQAINKETRQIDKPTDVLSFPLFHTKEEILTQIDLPDVLIGSIVISPDKAMEYQESLPQLVHHGLLHLCGFDHETDVVEWHQEEKALLSDLKKAGLTITGIPDDTF